MDQLDLVVVSTIVDITGTTPDHTVDGRVSLMWTQSDPPG
jgi:hypothetical protein